jgi:hypothetical protein
VFTMACHRNNINMFHLNTTLLLKVVSRRQYLYYFCGLILLRTGTVSEVVYCCTILILFEYYVFRLDTISHLLDVTYSFRLAGFGLAYTFMIFIKLGTQPRMYLDDVKYNSRNNFFCVLFSDGGFFLSRKMLD